MGITEGVIKSEVPEKSAPGTFEIFEKKALRQGGTTANFQIPSFGELRKVSHYSELCGLFFVGKIVRRAKTSVAQK